MVQTSRRKSKFRSSKELIERLRVRQVDAGCTKKLLGRTVALRPCGQRTEGQRTYLRIARGERASGGSEQLRQELDAHLGRERRHTDRITAGGSQLVEEAFGLLYSARELLRLRRQTEERTLLRKLAHTALAGEVGTHIRVEDTAAGVALKRFQVVYRACRYPTRSMVDFPVVHTVCQDLAVAQARVPNVLILLLHHDLVEGLLDAEPATDESVGQPFDEAQVLDRIVPDLGVGHVLEEPVRHLRVTQHPINSGATNDALGALRCRLDSLYRGTELCGDVALLGLLIWVGIT